MTHRAWPLATPFNPPVLIGWAQPIDSLGGVVDAFYSSSDSDGWNVPSEVFAGVCGFNEGMTVTWAMRWQSVVEGPQPVMRRHPGGRVSLLLGVENTFFLETGMGQRLSQRCYGLITLTANVDGRAATNSLECSISRVMYGYTGVSWQSTAVWDVPTRSAAAGPF